MIYENLQINSQPSHRDNEADVALPTLNDNVREMFANPNAENYQTPGDSGTGANSGHFLVNHSILSLLPKYSVPTTGSVHTGETNWTNSPEAAVQHLLHEQ